MESSSTLVATDKEALEAFVSDNDELEQLERLLSPFNIFEVLGASWHELRHSEFLAFLLDPAESHGLGNTFLKRFLMSTLKPLDAKSRALSLVDVDVADWSNVEVQREWRSIDILVLVPSLSLAVVIENKIWSGEHDGQLARYWSEAELSRLARNVLGIFLTPAGLAPSDTRYVAQSYGTVAEILASLLGDQASTMGPDVQVFVRHYLAMLRRHVLEDSEVALLARRIYRKHRRAIDLIVEHRPDRQEELYSTLTSLVSSTSGLQIESSSKRWVRFTPKAWNDRVPALGEGWVDSNRMLVFEFENTTDRIFLKLIIGPGESRIRQELFDWALANRPRFRPTRGALTQSWQTIWRRDFLFREQLDEEDDVVHSLLQEKWEDFLREDLPILVDLVPYLGGQPMNAASQ